MNYYSRPLKKLQGSNKVHSNKIKKFAHYCMYKTFCDP